VRSSPAIYNGIAYFGSNDNYVYALNASTGSLVWRRSVGGAIPLSSPTYLNGIIYIGSDDSKLYALNSTNGSVIWTYTAGGPLGSSSPAYWNGILFIGSQDKSVYAVNATNGSKIWSYTTSGQVGNGCCMARGGYVYFGSADKYVYKLDASTGSLVWRYRTGGAVDGNPSYGFGMVFVGSHDAKIYAFNDTTGLPVWTTSGDQQILESNAALGADYRIVIGSGANRILCLNASTGALIWNFSAEKDTIGGAALSNGMNWFGADDRYMYAIGGDPACGYTTFLWNSNLTIWDDTATQNRTPGQQVLFYANYTFENGTAITNSSPHNGTVLISFYLNSTWTAWANMTYNASSGLYYLNRSFSAPGIIPYNVTASAQDAVPLDASSSATISPEANQTCSVAAGKGNYSACRAVYYRARLYDSGSNLVNDTFDIKITDPYDVARQSRAGLYPNNGTGIFLGNYSVPADLPEGLWYIRALINGTGKGSAPFQVQR